MKKSKIIVLSAICCGVSLIAGIATQRNVVDAESAENKAIENYFVAGGSVRVVDDEHGTGIRFHVMMSENDYAENVKGGVITGTLILPKSLLANGELTLNNANALNIETTNVWEKTTYNDTAYMQSIAYVYNIPAENYGSDLYARGYVKSGNKITYTELSAPMSMSWVAKDEYNDTNSLLTAEQKKTLKETYIDFSVSYYVDGEEPVKDVISYDEKLTKPQDPVKDGYRFKGWFDKSGNNEWDFNNNSVSGITNLYAKFIKTYKVTFTDGGSNSIVKEYEENETITDADLPDLTSDTLIHKGWKSEIDKTVTKDVTYTAMMYHPVKTVADFNAIGETRQSRQQNYILVDDIDAKGKTIYTVANYEDSAQEADQFYGVFDGNGHTISNCEPIARCKKTTNCSLFGQVNGKGVIRNLNVVNCNVRQMGGGLATANYGTIENCFISATITGVFNVNNPSGGIVSKNGGKIKNCVAVITAGSGVTNAFAGGIVGRTVNKFSVIENCYLYSETFDVFEKNVPNGGVDLGKTTNTQAVKTAEALKALDYSMFDSAVWDFSGEYPKVKAQA